MPACGSSPRCARCARSPNCGTRSPRERYGVTDPKQRLFRYGVQVNSLGLTEQQPENNVYRILIEMLAVTLSKNARARAVQLPAWNEALGLPRPWDQQWSLRMQQILAYETDLLEYGDIFDGSTVIAAQGRGAEARGARRARPTSSELGGAIAAVEIGYMKAQLVESNAARRGDRARRADRRRRQQIHRDRTLAALRRRGRDPHRAARRSRPSRSSGSTPGARRATARRSRPRSRELRAGGARRPQHHAGLDRVRQGRRHHRRMGRGAARGVRRVPRADRRRPRGPQRQRGARRRARRHRPRVEEARPPR